MVFFLMLTSRVKNHLSFPQQSALVCTMGKNQLPGKKTGPFFPGIAIFFLGKVRRLSNRALYHPISYSYDLLIYSQSQIAILDKWTK